MLAAILMAVLAGFVGLAVDTGLWYTTQLRMQNAADAAALAGAIQLAKPGQTESAVIVAAEEGAAANGFDVGDGATVTVTIAPGNDSVAVEITEAAVMTLASLFLSEAVSIRARAVAGLSGGQPICILALDPSSSDALYLDSNAELRAPDCAIQVNSTSSSGLHIKSNSGVEALSVCVTGNYRDESSGSISPAPQTRCPAEADPLASLAAPAIGGCTRTGLELDNANTTLSPGIYCNGLTIKGNSNVSFNPGTYIIKDQKFFVDSNSRISGSGVSFYLKGSNAVIEFNSNSVVNLSASTTGPLAGILFFHDRSASGLPVHRIDSNSNNKRLEGMIYLPAAKLLVDSNGTVGGSSPCTLMIAKRFEFNSNSVVEVSADLGACPVPITTAYAGGGSVRLTE